MKMALFEKINSIISKGLSKNRFRLFALFFFLFVILILTYQMTYITTTTLHSDKSFYYIWVAYFAIIMGVILFNMSILVPRYLLTGKVIKYILSILGCVSLTLVLIIIAQNSFFEFDESDNPDNLLLNLFGNLSSTGMIIVSTSIYALFRGWADYNRQVTELEASTKEAELQQLKSQVNPHFLFNTINNVNIKVEKEPGKAYEMITKLEDLLHYQLKDTKQEKVFLKNDILFFTDYLELEKTRRNRFSYTIEADPEVNNLEVYPLLFIPFVENAVKHSLSAKGESIINIVFTREQDNLYFRCENTRPPVPVKHKSGGLGLKNIKRRLDLLYGGTYTLNITEPENKYIVELWLKI